MGLSSKKLLEIAITVSGKRNILEEIQKYLKSDNRQQTTDNRQQRKPLIIFTPNPEIINYAQRDPILKQIVNSAQINIPDGAGVEWGIKKLYGRNIERFSGVDLVDDLCSYSTKEGLVIGLIGGRGGVALIARECLLKTYPRLNIEVFEAPEFEKSKIKNQKSKINIKNQKEEVTEKYFESLAKELIYKKISILFVGLGCPKQEYFIENIKYQISNIKSYQPLLMMAVGGSFDYISGRITRAPFWMREKGLEWLYRLVREPWRLPRQIKGAEFFYRVILNKLRI